ncbi:M56 family metallopeptidase [Dyella subtropica]|uniref:M56 family metallopeptidase n=1 Tax=Dyella subtropica TaxID=2992127 RepID=UPI00224CC1F2|nr:M56 family metallopeptidase [Dyella subtropica]
MSSPELIARLWMLQLAFTVATLVVVLLRRPCRRLLGAERSFQLWLLPPLAMLVSQLPHPFASSPAVLPAFVLTITTAGGVFPAAAKRSMDFDWRAAIVLTWVVGVIIVGVIASLAQLRYRRQLKGAVPVGLSMRWLVWRARSPEVGPALVGAWRPRIVLPSDFDVRYDAQERMLILAHEAAHARRRDGLWSLCALIVVAMCWAHALVWWALRLLRQDQELACDAAVMRDHRDRRHPYALAMLKTQPTACVLPVGCTWSPRHPLTERIAMLKLSLPGPVRRRTGVIASFVLSMAVSGVVYAVSAPSVPESTATKSAHAAAVVNDVSATREYQLDMKVEVETEDAGQRHAKRTALALCMAPGQDATMSVRDWNVDATVTPSDGGQVRVALALRRSNGVLLAQSHLHGSLDETLRSHGDGEGADGAYRYAFEIIPRAGCPARAAAGAAKQES